MKLISLEIENYIQGKIPGPKTKQEYKIVITSQSAESGSAKTKVLNATNIEKVFSMVAVIPRNGVIKSFLSMSLVKAHTAWHA